MIQSGNEYLRPLSRTYPANIPDRQTNQAERSILRRDVSDGRVTGTTAHESAGDAMTDEATVKLWVLMKDIMGPDPSRFCLQTMVKIAGPVETGDIRGLVRVGKLVLAVGNLRKERPR